MSVISAKDEIKNKSGPFQLKVYKMLSQNSPRFNEYEISSVDHEVRFCANRMWNGSGGAAIRVCCCMITVQFALDHAPFPRLFVESGTYDMCEYIITTRSHGNNNSGLDNHATCLSTSAWVWQHTVCRERNTAWQSLKTSREGRSKR